MRAQNAAPLDLKTEREKYFEFVGGQYVERIIGSKLHSEFQFRVLSLLKAIAKQRGGEAWQEWTFAHGDDWRTPDVLLSFPGELQTDARGYLLSPPFLCVEILSPSQSEADLFRKCRQYHLWGVPHCWIIDPETSACFEYHGGNDFVLVEPDGFLTAGDVRLAAAKIFADPKE